MSTALTTLSVLLLIAAPNAHACWEDAARRYGVNPAMLVAIARTESGMNPDAINRNRNGSVDLGLMQINSRWFPLLRQYGIGEQQLRDPCTSIHVGAWILSQNMQRLGNSWDAVGAYNSSSPALRAAYAQRVYRNLPR
jgi:soluble lytic murein transglycosylase-like protein